MKTKITALLAGVLLLVLALPAWAAHTYVGTAEATGLELSLAGQTASIGVSDAAVQSAPTADGCGTDRGQTCASGAGALILGDSAQAHLPGGLADAVIPPFPLPATPFELLTGDIGLGRASVNITGDDRTAKGEGGASTLALTGTAVLGATVPVQEALGAISDALIGPVGDGDPTGIGTRLLAAVDVLRDDLSAAPLVTFSGAATDANAQDVGGKTTATASTQAGTLVVAPTEDSLPDAPEGLIIIEVGEASATATSDQLKAEASFTAAPVTVRVFDPVTLEYIETTLDPGESACAAEDTPLEACVVAGDGEETVQGAGSASAAAGIAISVLADPLPTLTLVLGQAEAAVAAAPPPVAPAPVPVPAPGPQAPAPTPRPAAPLPRTGADVTLPALGLLSLGALGLLGSRRRR